MQKRKVRSLNAVQQRAGYLFVLPWVLGLLLFLIIPLFSSIWYSFADVKIEPNNIKTIFIGLANYKSLLFEDPDYTNNLSTSITYVLCSVPLILAFSLITAVLLNQNFKGRTLFRALFFSPIIISTSAVMKVLQSKDVKIPLFTDGEELGELTEIVNQLNLDPTVTAVFTFILQFTLQVMQNSAVPIVLIIAGLQDIPQSLYEVSKIEGANKWEEFWMITVPSLRNILSLVMIYAMIDSFSHADNIVVTNAENLLNNQKFGPSSAMLWFYFSIVIIIMGIVYSIYNRYCMKKWD